MSCLPLSVIQRVGTSSLGCVATSSVRFSRIKNNWLESLHGLLPWSCWTQHRCKLYCMFTCFTYLEKELSAKKKYCTNHEGGLMEMTNVHKFHEINKINISIFISVKKWNVSHDATLLHGANSCAQPCAHQTTHF